MEEFDNLKFQFGISSWGGTRNLPYALLLLFVAVSLSVVILNIQAKISYLE